MEFLQVLITGLGQGCLYGLIALGFVLIYKATEIVNFAQGELLMMGAFFAVTYVMILGLPFWLGLHSNHRFHGCFRLSAGYAGGALDDWGVPVFSYHFNHQHWLYPARGGRRHLGGRYLVAGNALLRENGQYRRACHRPGIPGCDSGDRRSFPGPVSFFQVFQPGDCHAGRFSESAGSLLHGDSRQDESFP